MSYNGYQSAATAATFEDKMFGAVEVSEERAHLAKVSYALLTLSCVSMAAGGYIGATTPVILNFFAGPIGWITAMVLLNVLPNVAIACRHNAALGTLALIGDGFVAGIVLGPLLYVAAMASSGSALDGGNLIVNAMMMTFAVFIAVSGFVWMSGRHFSAPRGLMFGFFIAIVAAVALSFIFPLGGIMGIVISIAIGMFGVAMLVYATSDMLHNPMVDSPIYAAVTLFSGVFMVFQSILYLLLSFGRD